MKKMNMTLTGLFAAAILLFSSCKKDDADVAIDKTNDGTFSNVTDCTRPLSILACAVINPAGASILTVVIGSTA